MILNEKEKAKMRVAVAKDVIKNLDNLTVKKGIYCVFNGLNANGNSELRDHLKGVECHVCALGAAMISHVRLYDNFKVARTRNQGSSIGYGRNQGSSIGYGTICETLTKYFHFEQLKLIEAYFETWGESDKKISKYLGKPPATRLKMIMENIIKHKGIFKP